MSKFFKALETAERERERGTATAAATVDAPAQAPEPVPAPPPPPPPPPVATAAPSAAPPTVVAPPGAAPAVAPPIPRRSVYGAPVSRDHAPAPGRQRALDTLLEPVASAESSALDDHLVSLLAPTTFAAEQYRAVRLSIENLGRERGTRLVAVSSPSRGDGKTITAINVAGALAQAPDARVALVEVDLRHPGVARALGLNGGFGLSRYLMDPTLSLDSVLGHPAGIGFAVLPAGPASSMPYELLKSPRLASLLGTLRERFDFVVVDTPPVVPFPDVGILRDLMDGFLLVVRANRTPRELVRDSVATIGAGRTFGIVFNDDDRPLPLGGAEPGWRGYLARPRGAGRAA